MSDRAATFVEGWFSCNLKMRWWKLRKAWFEGIKGVLVKGGLGDWEIEPLYALGVLVKSVYPRWAFMFTML
jgi:hypothetical protein